MPRKKHKFEAKENHREQKQKNHGPFYNFVLCFGARIKIRVTEVMAIFWVEFDGKN